MWDRIVRRVQLQRRSIVAGRALTAGVPPVIPRAYLNGMAVEFAGGLGAQVLAAAAYFYLKLQGANVSADTTYFDADPTGIAHLPTRHVSIWRWELDAWRLSRQEFEPSPDLRVPRVSGDLLMAWAVAGLQLSSIRSRFRDDVSSDKDFLPPYACVHVRRGDFLGVASKVLWKEDYERVVERISGLLPRVVVVSDTSLEQPLEALLRRVGIG